MSVSESPGVVMFPRQSGGNAESVHSKRPIRLRKDLPAPLPFFRLAEATTSSALLDRGVSDSPLGVAVELCTPSWQTRGYAQIHA